MGRKESAEEEQEENFGDVRELVELLPAYHSFPNGDVRCQERGRKGGNSSLTRGKPYGGIREPRQDAFVTLHHAKDPGIEAIKSAPGRPLPPCRGE